MATKIIGFGLLTVGLLIIGWTMFSSFNIFTGQVAGPEIFKLQEEKTISQQVKSQDIQAQLQKMIEEQLKGILPADTMPKMLNLTVWSILAGLLIFGGGQISSLGIKLILIK